VTQIEKQLHFTNNSGVLVVWRVSSVTITVFV